MVSKRPARRSSNTPTTAIEKTADCKTEAEPREKTPSPQVDEPPKGETQEEQLPALLLPSFETTEAPAPQLSKRALKRMRGWEPVIKPLEDVDATPLCAVPTSSVVWLDNSTKVTLIPNNGGGVHTRRGAATLAAASPPTSYLVYTRDPLIKVTRVGTQNVHVITNLPPGGDPESILRTVSSLSSTTQRNGGTSTRESNAVPSSSVSSSQIISSTRIDDVDEGGEVMEAGHEEDEEEEDGEEEEEEEGGDANNTSIALGPQQKNEVTVSAKQSVPRRNRRTHAKKKRKRSAAKRADDAAAPTSQTRIGVISAAQAMLPPPYRRNRRLKRKMHITEDTAVFATHSELRDRMPQLFPKAPFSTEEDVLRSTLDWQDNVALVYARLLWEFAPNVLLKRAMRQQDDGDSAVGPGEALVARSVEVKKEEEESEEEEEEDGHG